MPAHIQKEKMKVKVSKSLSFFQGSLSAFKDYMQREVIKEDIAATVRVYSNGKKDSWLGFERSILNKPFDVPPELIAALGMELVEERKYEVKVYRNNKLYDKKEMPLEVEAEPRSPVTDPKAKSFTHFPF